MPIDTPTDKFLQTRTNADKRGGAIVPFNQPKEFHKFDRDLYGLVEYPTKALILAFQDVFSTVDKWRFDPDVTKTKIYIQDRYPQTTTGEAEAPALRPALITDRGPISLMNINGRGHNKRVSKTVGNQTGLVTFEDIVQCPMTIHCLAPVGPEAERLASIVFATLVVDEITFKARYGMHAILNPEIGGEGPLEQTSQLELVDVTVSFTMQYAWAWARRPDGDPFESLASLTIEDP